MKTFNELDVFRCPLEGIHLIEASAGTGKTWAICGLYLRMILEQERTVDQILVVTFTNAATAELRNRIRGRIVETLGDLQRQHASTATGDPFVRKLITRLEGELQIGREALIKRLALARETFDEAAIFTIHGFCQRALAGTPFAAGLPFELELVKDDRLLIQQAVNDFWRRHIAYPVFSALTSERPADISPLLASDLIQKGDGPEKYARLIRRILGKPLSSQKWPDLPEEATPLDDTAVQRAYDSARTLWQNEADEITTLILGALDQLNKQSYPREGVEQGKQDWTVWFRSSQPIGLYPGAKSKIHLYRSSKLQHGEKKKCKAPHHVFFDAAEALCQAIEDLQQALVKARLRLLRRLIDTVPPDLRQNKRQHRFVAFDDMLFNLHRALVSGDFPSLASSLGRQYPVALIDEFQDTDPLQFEIFKTLYHGGERAEGSLFMVGDPKQAIYSFRNADLYTYLGAQELATQHHTLAANQRSEASLIRACNALFGANRKAFLLDGIDYRPVKKGQRPVPCFRDQSPEQRSPLQVWLLPGHAEKQWLSRADAFDRSSLTVAGEISRLLKEGSESRITIDGRGLLAGDVAVLVRSHAHGRRMRLALAELGIGSVELSQASVFGAEEAEELERILLAIAEPGSERLLRAALATEILGRDADALAAMVQQEADFFECMQRFADYRSLWEQRGFAMMFRKLLREESVETRLLRLNRGERRLTNVLHLAELLAAAAQEQRSSDGLLRWLRTRREEADAEDVAQLRLESDRNLVQIITIHKAKGLEYPIVFCPFLWDGYRTTRSDTPDLLEYHENEGTAVLDFRPDAKDDATVKSLRRDEHAAETLRLIYVALTRAVHRCYLIAGCYSTLAFGNPTHSESTRSMLNWLVSGEGLDADQWFKAKLKPEQIDSAWLSLSARCQPDCEVEELPDMSGLSRLETEATPEVLSARIAPGPIAESWSRNSFSGMIRNLTFEAVAADHDAGEDVDSQSSSKPAAGSPDDDILAFPRGPAAGECLHHLFEHVDFTDSTGWDEAIENALAVHPQGIGRAQSDALRPMLRGMLGNVLATDLKSGLQLRTIRPEQRLNELAFTLPAEQLQPTAVNRFLDDYGYPVGRLDFPTLTGYLSGAIDLVFWHEERYFLLDWKSNYLGNGVGDYAKDRMERAMTQHAYRLQYLLYSVALHRFLQRRCRDYDYQRHFGGVFYLFVRGVRPAWLTAEGPAGVFFDRPSAEAVMRLDTSIGGSIRGATA